MPSTTKQTLSRRALTALLLLSVFLIPSNLFARFFEHQAYVNGILVDYLLVKLYLSDIVVASVIVLWLASRRKIWKRWLLLAEPRHAKKLAIGLGLILLAFTARQLTSIHQLSSFSHLVRLGMTVLWGAVLYHELPLIRRKLVMTTLIGTLVFQSCLGLYQLHTQHSLGGFWLLGETSLQSYAGLARGYVGSEYVVLPYGTTPHPNILAGTLVLLWLTLYRTLLAARKNNATTSKAWHAHFLIISILSGATLWLTQSLSAFLTLILGLLIFELRVNRYDMLKKIVVFSGAAALCLSPWLLQQVASTPTQTSIQRRQHLNQAAWKVFEEAPLLGTGLTVFTTQVERVSESSEIVRFIQPAHHVGLLWLAEGGALGVIVVVACGWLLGSQLSSKVRWQLALALVIVVPIASLDHYLLTQQTGLMLVAFWLGSTRVQD